MAEVTIKIRAGVCTRLLSGTALVAPFAAILLSSPALADCSPPGGPTVTCTGTTAGFGDGTQSNLTINIQSGATVSANPALNIDSTNIVNNSGTISTGDSGFGIQLQNNNTINNSGTIRAGVDGDTIRGVGTSGNTVNNTGTIDGRVVLNGVGNVLINSGVLAILNANTATGAAHTTNTFTQTASGTLAVQVDNVSGMVGSILAATANINGTLRIIPRAGLYDPVTAYDNIVNASGTLNGTFSTVTSASPFLTPSIVTDGTTIDLTLTRVGFGSVSGMTPNQRAVGNAIEPGYSTALTGNAATFYGNLLAATSVSALDQLSGQGVSASQGASFGAGSLFTAAMSNQGLNGDSSVTSVVFDPAPLQYAPSKDRKPRGSDAFASLVTKAPPIVEQPGRWRVWTAGFGADRRVDGETSPGSASQTSRSYGGVIGVDHQVSRDLLLGIAAGGSESNFSVSDLSTSGRATGGHVGIYAVKTWNAFYAAASLSYARFDNSTTRTITGIGPTETATGSFASDLFGGRVELGWKQAYRGFTVTPFVAVEPSTLRQRGFTETSVQAGGAPGILGLTVDARTTNSLPTFVGAQFDTRTTFSNGWVLSPFARLSWVHEFEPNRRVSASFITLPTAAFTVDGARAASDSARLDTGARLTMLPGKSLFANFTGEWSDRSRSYAAVGGFRVAW